MKTPSAPRLPSPACLLGLLCAVSSAPVSLGQPVPARQNVERLTLLTGPHLLSPPHGAPATKGPGAVEPLPITGAVPPFRFIPASGPLGSAPALARGRENGTLVLGLSAPPPGSDIRIKPTGTPTADSLRFEATLHPAAQPLNLRSLPPRSGPNR